MTPSPIRGVIFDLGSTLIDFEGDTNRVMSESLAELADHLLGEGLDFTRSDFIDRFDQALRTYYANRDQDHIERTTFAVLRGELEGLTALPLEEPLLRRGLSAMYAVSEACWQPKPAMRAVLDRLSGQGYRLGLLSNAGDVANVQRLIDKAAIRSYFDPILISAAIGIRKPDPRPMQMILEQWQLPASDVVMVGDLLQADILGAQRAGIHHIWLCEDSNPESRDPSEAIQPDAIAVDLAEVPAILQGWDQKG
ncbi:MAG: HAD family hydrolase [Anaerolineales bacterium]|nr:MAG: HAD family hydrolase [Anaerolineales bacterium]